MERNCLLVESGFGYKEKELAERCEDWCSETGTCSIEITEHAVYFPED
jgi:hypothetical protein